MATSAPSCARASAAARPMPAEAPVTRATLPCSFIAFSCARGRAIHLWGLYIEGMIPGNDPAISAPPPWRWPRAAYVHIPFCAHHCGYCDFAIAVGQEGRIDAYLDALAAELATLGEPQPVRSVFLGGGTPTYLSAAQLARLLAAVT